MSNQDEQQLEFLRAQIETMIGNARLAADRVNRQIGQVDGVDIRLYQGAFGPPQNGLNACHQFAWIKGFGQVIVGPEFQAEDFIYILVAGGQHYDRHRVVFRPQAAADIQPVQPGKHYIKHNQLWG